MPEVGESGRALRLSWKGVIRRTVIPIERVVADDDEVTESLNRPSPILHFRHHPLATPAFPA
ncbi:glycosyltransferase family protein [Pseudomonas tructae]|uniref:hypothetical protein n=1 Tax=Pseudomonas tructae TaxID=2518644 RepID=UPI0013EEA746|nr:hypothetical protein [Pseudomonas tructae]